MHQLVICSTIMLPSLALAFQSTQALNTCTPPTLLNDFQKPNFMSCLSTIQNLTIDQRRDSGCFNGDPEEGILSLIGCELMCGTGYSLWEWKDTFNRLSLLVLPTVVLIAHLAFPPLGWHNYLIVTFHAVGNPIGSLRSLLTRFEVYRRLRRAAEKIFPRKPLISGAVATIFAAYEELGWQDGSVNFTTRQALSERETLIITRASHELSSTRLASTFSASVAIATLVGTLATAIIRTIQQIDENNTRVYIETAHTIAVVCILFISIPQVWFSARLGTFTTDSGAIQMINTMNGQLEDLTGINGRTIPLFPPLQLGRCSLPPSDRRWLELWLSKYGPSWLEGFFSHCPLPLVVSGEDTENRIFCRSWQESPCYLGINSSWRPCKHTPRDEYGPNTFQLLLISILWVVFGACLPAIFLSATNHTDRRRIAVGCRSLTWIVIMGTWLFSLAADSIIRFGVCRYSPSRDAVEKLRLIWRWTLVKDTFTTFIVTALILVVEVGTYNSCWCRSSFSHPGIVDLMPYSPSQWTMAKALWAALPSSGLAVNLGLIMWIELRWSERNGFFPRFSRERGSPLCKSGREMQEELKELKRLENRRIRPERLGFGYGLLKEHRIGATSTRIQSARRCRVATA